MILLFFFVIWFPLSLSRPSLPSVSLSLLLLPEDRGEKRGQGKERRGEKEMRKKNAFGFLSSPDIVVPFSPPSRIFGVILEKYIWAVGGGIRGEKGRPKPALSF